MQRLRTLFFVLILVLSGLTSCSKHQKLLKSNNFDEKYQGAKEYLKKKDYSRAFPLLEELSSIYRGTARAEEIYFDYAYCNYHLNDLASAAYHFEQFAKNYPNSLRNEEALYMAAYCYYLGSPEYTLDQTNTYKAIEELQSFVNLYPRSERVQKCNELIDQLRDKLEKKAVSQALMYYQINDYKAAIVAIKNVLAEFPATKSREQLMFLSIKSHYLLAENSIESKKAERYKGCVDAYIAFNDKFANAKNIKEAETYYKSALNKLKLFQTASSN